MNNFHLLLISCCLFTTIINVLSLKSEAIINGQEVNDKQYGYHVFIKMLDFNCNGALIRNNYVITAAACVTSRISIGREIKTNPITVIINYNGKESIEDPTKAFEVETVSVLMDTLFPRSSNLEDCVDLAILKLSKPVPNAKIIDLPWFYSFETYENQAATVTGYGWNTGAWHYSPSYHIEGSSNDKLHRAQLNVRTISECSVELNRVGITHTNKYLCARRIDKPASVCYGDKGAPLVIGNTLIGILSRHPVDCRESERSSIYMRVSSHLVFVNDVLFGNKVPTIKYLSLLKSTTNKDRYYVSMDSNNEIDVKTLN